MEGRQKKKRNKKRIQKCCKEQRAGSDLELCTNCVSISVGSAQVTGELRWPFNCVFCFHFFEFFFFILP